MATVTRTTGTRATITPPPSTRTPAGSTPPNGAPSGTASNGTPSTGTAEIAWRRLNRTFWVGRQDDRHAGSIEHGRYYTAVDGTGRFAGRYRSFADADRALQGPRPEVVPERDAGHGRVLPAVTGAAGVITVGLALVGWLFIR